MCYKRFSLLEKIYCQNKVTVCTSEFLLMTAMRKIIHFKERNSSQTLHHTSNVYICNAHPLFSFFDHINEERIVSLCANLTRHVERKLEFKLRLCDSALRNPSNSGRLQSVHTYISCQLSCY